MAEQQTLTNTSLPSAPPGGPEKTTPASAPKGISRFKIPLIVLGVEIGRAHV